MSDSSNNKGNHKDEELNISIKWILIQLYGCFIEHDCVLCFGFLVDHQQTANRSHQKGEKFQAWAWIFTARRHWSISDCFQGLLLNWISRSRSYNRLILGNVNCKQSEQFIINALQKQAIDFYLIKKLRKRHSN